MKKITLLVCILVIGFANAQDDTTTSDKLTFEKGAQFVNANLSLNFANSDFESQSSTQTQEIKTFEFNINSSYAYAVRDNLFLGLGLGYSYSSRKDQPTGLPEDKVTTNSYQVFPFVRYYKGIGKKIAVFIQGEARYSHFETEVNILNAASTSNNFFFGIRPGLTLMLNKNLALETSIGVLGYSTGNSENDSNDSESSFNNFNFSLNSSNLFFGLSYYL